MADWIDVNKELPQEFRDVQVAFQGNLANWYVRQGYWTGSEWELQISPKHFPVEFWMPLPEPPK